MKKAAILILLLVLGFSNSFASNDFDLNLLRKEYFKAVDDENLTEQLLTQLSLIEAKTAILLGFEGSLLALKAKHSWNPVVKMNSLKKGKVQLDEAIFLEDDNLELRFLRFSLEYNLPSVLGMSSHLEEDKNKILLLVSGTVKSIDSSVLRTVASFLIDANLVSEAQTRMLRLFI
ncbi:MAG: hypothetical protein ACJAZ3_000931 [Sphingobacteriales bacterium]|jgi:hypothetical protein